MSSEEFLAPHAVQPKESPSSPVLIDEGPSTSNAAPAIPVYSVSDSDEDRANAFMKDISNTLLQDDASKNKLKQQLSMDVDSDVVQIIDLSASNEYLTADETPSVQVTFMNTEIGRKYRHDIESFLHTLMVTEHLSKDREPLPKIQPRPNLNLEDEDESKKGVIQPTTVIGTISVSSNVLFLNLAMLLCFLCTQAVGLEIVIILWECKDSEC